MAHKHAKTIESLAELPLCHTFDTIIPGKSKQKQASGSTAKQRDVSAVCSDLSSEKQLRCFGVESGKDRLCLQDVKIHAKTGRAEQNLFATGLNYTPESAKSATTAQ